MEQSDKISDDRLDDRGVQFSPHKTVSRVYCCVFGCKTSALMHPTLRFHKIPKSGERKVKIKNVFGNEEEIDRRKAWEKGLKLKNVLSDHARVCSLHFCKEDYAFPDFTSGRRRLKVSAVPCLNIPGQDLKKVKNALKRKQRSEERCKKKLNLDISITKKNKKANEYVDQDMDVENETLIIDCEKQSNCVNQSSNVNKTGSADLSDHNNLSDYENQSDSVQIPVESRVEVKDRSVQTNSELYFNMIKSERDLKTMTGIPNFKILNVIKNTVDVVLYSTSNKVTKLSVLDKIIMTFIKLKQNISYSMLSSMFQICSEENCRKVVIKMIEILSNGLQFAIRWPSKEEVLKNIPECFRNFENVRTVIDGIEIQIQQPKKLCCRIASYSSYKGTNTIKFVTAVSPAGLITYISKPYLGRSSDKAIFEESNLIELLDAGDVLMTDKGFLIDEICLLNDIKLVRPPFLKNNQQFSKEESLLNAAIAKAWVHIKRSNQRIKVFKILSTKLPSYLVPKIEEIFTIICAIVNLSSPILKDDKFN